MKSKSLTTMILTAVILTSQASAVFAASSEGGDKALSIPVYSDAKPINTPVDEVTPARRANFNAYSGIIKSVKDYEAVKGSKLIELEDGQGNLANVIVSDNTYFVNGKEMEVGSKITAYYDANASMIMIYPPQYKAEVIAVGDEAKNIKVDLFNENLISADGQLKIRINSDVEVVTQDGRKFEGDITNKNLVVTYTVATKSIPAQTTPNKVVILDKKTAEIPEVIAVPEGTENNAVEIKDSNVSDKKTIKHFISSLLKFIGKF